MLGEDHSLFNDFPEKTELINQLIATDSEFAAAARRYHALDKEIRNLELRNSPIDDQAMQQLKHDRAELKDALYRKLQLGA